MNTEFIDTWAGFQDLSVNSIKVIATHDISPEVEIELEKLSREIAFNVESEDFDQALDLLVKQYSIAMYEVLTYQGRYYYFNGGSIALKPEGIANTLKALVDLAISNQDHFIDKESAVIHLTAHPEHWFMATEGMIVTNYGLSLGLSVEEIKRFS